MTVAGATKIRLKLGQLEVEYEGQLSFLEDGLFKLLEKTVALYAMNNIIIPADSSVESKGNSGNNSQKGTQSLTTGTIAAHLNVSNATDLAIAAAAQLTFYQSKEKFSRKEINDEMKSAVSYYKTNMGSNLSKSIDTLVKSKRLNEVTNGIYALSETEKQSLKSKLA